MSDLRQFIKDGIKTRTYQTRFDIPCDFPQEKVEIMIDEIFIEWQKLSADTHQTKNGFVPDAIKSDSIENNDSLVAFMLWYKNNVPIGTQKSSYEIVKDFLKATKSN